MTEPETTRPTFEVAKRCPTCSQPGQEYLTQPAPAAAGLPRGTKIVHIRCEHTLCPDYAGVWLVQVNPDGSVPEPKNHTGEPKIYAGFEHDDAAAENVRQMLAVELELSKRRDGHGEIRGR